MSIRKKAVIVTATLGVLAGIVIASNLTTPKVNPPVPTPTHVAPTYRQDTQVVTVMQSLGLDYSKLNLIAGADPKLPDAYATFESPNTMYISDKVGTDILNRVVSHEYIHYVQFTLSPAEATGFYPYVTDLANTNPYLESRTVNYKKGTECGGTCNVPAEAEAIACTEMPDAMLRPDFLAFCNKYLPNRAALL